MAKGNDKKEVRGEINQEQSQVDNRYRDLYSDLDQKRNTITERSDSERSYLTDQFRANVDSGTGGLDSNVINNIRSLYGWRDGTGTSSGADSGGSSGGGGGGSSVANTSGAYDEVEGRWRNIADTGAMDINRIRDTRSGLEGIAKDGGFDPTDVEGIRGNINRLNEIGKDGGFSPERRASIQDSIGTLKSYGSSGGYDPDVTARLRGDFSNMRSLSGTGGFDPNALADSRNRIAYLDELARTGGMSDDDISRFRGTGFSEFAETGGWSPEQISEYRNRSTSVIPAAYQSTMDEAGRLRNAGGSNAGFLAAASKLGRQSNQDLATASRNAEIDLGGQVREGRRWGIEGLRDTEKQLQDILVPAKTQSASAAAQYGNQLEGNVANNRIDLLKSASSGEADLESNIARNRIGSTEAAAKLETDFQSAISSAMTSASKGAGDLQTNLANAVSQAKLRANELIVANETEAQKLQQQGIIAGTQGLTQVAAQKAAEARAASNAANAARESSAANDRWWATFQSNNERWIGEQMQRGEMDNLRGLTSVYGMDPTLQRDALQLSASDSWANANRGLLNTDAQLSQQQQGGGLFSTLGGGLLSMFGGGGGSGFSFGGGGGQRVSTDGLDGANPQGNIYDHSTVPGGQTFGPGGVPDPWGDYVDPSVGW